MSNDNVVKLIQPEILTDRLTEVLRDGARALLTQAVEAEVSEFLAATADLKTDDGCRRVVRHGHLPERQIMTGIGPVAVRQPRVRDREAGADDPTRIRFTPAILPPYARRSKSLDTLIPILYLRRPPNASRRTGTRCSPSTTSRPNIGSTCVRRIRSKAPSRPSDTGRSARRDASRTGPRSPWSSSWSKARRRPGVALTATTSCQRSFEV